MQAASTVNSIFNGGISRDSLDYACTRPVSRAEKPASKFLLDDPNFLIRKQPTPRARAPVAVIYSTRNRRHGDDIFNFPPQAKTQATKERITIDRLA
jgi:hypothetical protein